MLREIFVTQKFTYVLFINFNFIAILIISKIETADIYYPITDSNSITFKL